MALEAQKKRSRVLYRALDFVMLRAPALPFEHYLKLDAAAWAPKGSLRLAPIDPCVRRALAIGSPSLLEQLERTSLHDGDDKRVKGKLQRFLIRMSTRPTPYGTFAGVGLAAWGANTDVWLEREPTMRTRVDMDWVVRYVAALEAQPAIRTQLRWIANSAVWIFHDRAILYESAPTATAGAFASVSIAATSMARRALGLTRAPIRYDELVERLVECAPSATVEKVERLLQQMWQNGFLRTELMPPMTTEDPVQWVHDRVASITGGKSLCVQLDALARTVSACDTASVDDVPSALRKANAHLKMLGQTRTEMPLQVDMALGIGGTCLSSAIAEHASRTAELLLRLSPAPAGPPILAGYRHSFINRYGIDREVPLLELLHPEWGLGPIGQYGWGNAEVDPARASRRAETLKYLALRAIRDAQLVIDLDEELLERLETQTLRADALSTSLDLNLFVLAKSREAIDLGDFQLMVGPNVGAASAGRNLGRFSHLLGQRARGALELAARHDEQYHDDEIIAELAFLPRNFRSANVSLRPAVRRYEAPVGVSAAVDAQHIIPLDELVVGVRNNRFYVRWLARDMDIQFASGHMLNPNQSSSEIVHFLSEISRDGITQLSAFDWGPASGNVFLPRVQSGRSILQCAQWRFESNGQGSAPVDQRQPFADWLARWRERWRVPRRVYLTSADNRLLYDLEDPEQVEDLRGELRRAEGKCLLQEALPGPEHAWLPSVDGGHHIVELTVSLGLRSNPRKHGRSNHKPRVASLVTPDLRLRPPGSDWLYLKLYGPRSGEDEFIAAELRTLCREIDDAGVADEWFFVRYADPDPHLRLRFRASPTRLTEELYPRLCAWAAKLLSGGKRQKFVFDTYEREVERYGGAEATVLAEQFFAADSRAVADLFACSTKMDRLTLMVVSIDDLLDSLALDDVARLEWLKGKVVSRNDVSKEFRLKRDQLIAELRDPARVNSPVGQVLARRRSKLNEVATRLAELERNGALTQPIVRLYESYVHMHCNRLYADPSAEQRALGLLLRARDSIVHLPKLDLEGASAQ